MTRRRPPSHPGRPFVLVLLALSALVLLSSLRDLLSRSGPAPASTLYKRSSKPSKEPCHHVYRHHDQCTFIRNNCFNEESGLLSYLTLYFCDLPHLKPLAFIIIALWTALLFTTIGIAASDFFCINLSTISNILGMSESMAGVTFLAFGNGSPDVFSTFAAMKSNSGSLAIGELIGAAGFITAVVSGSMALVRPFKVAKKSFIRDVGFFIVSVAFSMWFLANGHLEMWECIVMVAFYLFYVLFVCIWHWWLGRRRKHREYEAAVRGHYSGADEFDREPEYRDDPEDDDDRGSRRSYAAPISTEDLNELERVDYYDDGINAFPDLEDDETRDKWMGELSSNMRITKPPDGERSYPFTPIRPSLVGALEFRAVLASLQKSRNLQSVPISMRRYSDAPVVAASAQQQDPNYNLDGNQTLLEVQDNPDLAPDLRLALEPSRSGRTRAVSANDAAALHIDPNVLPQTRDQNMDLLSSTPPRPDPNTSTTYGTFETFSDTSQPNNQTNSPLVAVSGPSPSSGALTVGDLLQPRPPRSRTVDFLAPPNNGAPSVANQRKARSENNSPDGFGGQVQNLNGKPQRPSLKLPMPHSSSSSPRFSPSHSPFLAGLPSRSASGTGSFALPPPSTPSANLFANDDSSKPIAWWPYSILPAPGVLARTLFPTLYGWKDKTLWERLLGIASAPCFFLLTITLPVVEPSKVESRLSESIGTTPNFSGSTRDFTKSPNVSSALQSSPPHPHSATPTPVVTIETTAQLSASPDQLSTNPTAAQTSAPTNSKKEWNRWLVMIQCFTSPYIVVVTVWGNTSEKPQDLVRPTLWSLLGSLLALLFILTTTTPTRPPRWHFMLCFVGFAVAITWISSIAEEVVGVLKAIGVIFNISDAILGLTIFAVGNSLGDLVADITVARLGFPVMALSACFGGPMLNILLGIGLSGLYATITGAQKHKRKHPDEPLRFKAYRIHVSPTLLISAVALLITLVGLLIIVPLNKWRMDKRIGWGLILLWVVGTLGNVLIEVTGLVGDSM